MAIKRVLSKVPGGFDTAPYNLTMTAIDTDTPEIEVLPYDPESFKQIPQANWAPVDAAGVEISPIEWKNNSPETTTWSQIIEVENVITDIGVEYLINTDKLYVVSNLLERLKTWKTEPTRKTQKPTRIRTTFGIDKQITGVISALSINHLKVRNDGIILKASYDITLMQAPQ